MFRQQYIARAALTWAFISVLTPVAQADFASSQRWFDSMAEDDRSLLQSRLMLLGHYNAIADSTFGNFTYRAIQAFQTSLGDSPTGALTTRQDDLLANAASSLYQELGFDIVEDGRAQMAMLLPQKLLPSVSETKRGNAYTSADASIRLETIRKPFSEESYESLYYSLASSSATRQVTYQTLNADRFVVSGTREGKPFYILINNTPGESAGFSIEWERSSDKIGAMVATFMASYSYPLAYDRPESSSAATAYGPEVSPQPLPQAAQPTTPAAPQSSSGTGFFVAERGVLVTNHHVIEGCSAIEVVGYGPVRTITSDADVDLAVLQLRTPKAHSVAEIRAESAQLGESVVALGYPLADILNSSLNMGTGIVSSETGFFGDQSQFTTNVGIQPGNSGGPILDEYGRVLGVAVSKINDEALLAAIGTTAPNVGFAIKGEAVADYLSLFRLPEPSAKPQNSLSARELAELGKNFTVQVTCDMEQRASSEQPSQMPVATNPNSAALPFGYRWVVLASAASIAALPDLSRAVYPATTRIVLSENGSFGLVAGPFMQTVAEGWLTDWTANASVPSDAYLSSGNRFVGFADGM